MNKRASKGLMLAALGAMAIAAGRSTLNRRRCGRSRLSGRVALITGGSRGLGLQLARQLASEGCKLILVARSDEELTVSRDELRTAGADVEAIACDLAKPHELAKMLTTAIRIHSHIDIIINNAGRIDVGPIDSFTEEDFHAAMDLMFWAPVRIVLGLLPALLKSGDADIVNISSVGGRIAVPHLLPYSSAKFALCGFSEGLDAEVRPRGVRVLTVTPGLLRTGSHKQASFTGHGAAEYQWFALGATVPGVSMEVDRAARQIVSALKARKRNLTLTWTAQLASRLHGAFPDLSIRLTSCATAFLPPASRDRNKHRGYELDDVQASTFKVATSMGEKAAKTQNENLNRS